MVRFCNPAAALLSRLEKPQKAHVSAADILVLIYDSLWKKTKKNTEQRAWSKKGAENLSCLIFTHQWINVCCTLKSSCTDLWEMWKYYSKNIKYYQLFWCSFWFKYLSTHELDKTNLWWMTRLKQVTKIMSLQNLN